jgi:hypothetical protein
MNFVELRANASCPIGIVCGAADAAPSAWAAQIAFLVENVT